MEFPVGTDAILIFNASFFPICSKCELYSMEWSPDTELFQMNVFAAPYGGPMAIIRDAKEFVKLGGSSVKPIIRIFTASGHPISTINVRSNRTLQIHFVSIVV